jgi:lauroyl/myristoyl acyltransferase
MLAKLAQPGGVVRIAIDALWEKPNAYRRPFAGLQERGFALGAARVARLAQCPLVFFQTTFQDDGSVLVERGDPMEPPPVDDRASDIAVTDRLLNELERWVARYPTQYLHPIGHDRCWNAETSRWETRPLRAAQAVSGEVAR